MGNNSKLPNMPLPPPMIVTDMGEGLHVVTGSAGANCAFFIAGDFVVVIDAKMTKEAATLMIEEIRYRTKKPIRYVVLTHSDIDHVGGLTAFAPDTQIIAHAAVLQEMLDPNAIFSQTDRLPNMTLQTGGSIHLGSDQIDLCYFGPAHTGGDLIIHFKGRKLAFVGDLVTVGRDTLIHRSKHGSAAGLINVLRATLQLDVLQFASGHADIVDRTYVESALKELEDKRGRVQLFVQEGRSLEDIKREFNITDSPVYPGGPVWMSLPEVMYHELTENK